MREAWRWMALRWDLDCSEILQEMRGAFSPLGPLSFWAVQWALGPGTLAGAWPRPAWLLGAR